MFQPRFDISCGIFVFSYPTLSVPPGDISPRVRTPFPAACGLDTWVTIQLEACIAVVPGL